MEASVSIDVLKQKVIFIAGLTASGKSQLALDIAAHYEAINTTADKKQTIIINTDSMQVYEGLHILTACPSDYDKQKNPHYLYEVIDPYTNFSTGAWVRAVEDLLLQAETKDKVIIFVGGTGLYFKALMGGLADIPNVDETIKKEAQHILETAGLNKLYEDVKQNDPTTAQRIDTNDKQRILRTWEVEKQTGRPLSFWQTQKKPPLFDTSAISKFVLLPPREENYKLINARVDKMIHAGVLDEIQDFMKRDLDPQLPAMKAAGLREFMAYLQGKTSYEEALDKAKQETRRYAKRQRTWFRNQLGEDWQKLEKPQFMLQTL